jgi:hypothetical protein
MSKRGRHDLRLVLCEHTLNDAAALRVARNNGGDARAVRFERLKSAMRALLSGPWHRKQVSDMIGRMSLLKLTSAAAQKAKSNVAAASRW